MELDNLNILLKQKVLEIPICIEKSFLAGNKNGIGDAEPVKLYPMNTATPVK
jgi:hypothetical protein